MTSINIRLSSSHLLNNTTSSSLSLLLKMAPALPDDILHLLCEQLAEQDQFDTLFNCACSNRALAVPALTHL